MASDDRTVERALSSPNCDRYKYALPSTLPNMRIKSRLVNESKFQSPKKNTSVGSPTYYGSPSRLHTLFRCYTWRDVKGHLSQTIGRGGFGSVHKASIHGFDLAIKKMRYTLMNKAAIFRSLQSERLAVSIRHRNIVTIYHVNDRSDPAFVIMEYVGRHTLQQVIDHEGVASERVHHFSSDIANALQYIHSLKIVHLDLKPSNVLITNYNVAKLGDFGCAQKLHWDDTCDIISPTGRSDITGTVAYRAPELLRGCPPSNKADIYAYGILVWQMLSCKLPYHGKDTHVVIFSVVAHNLRPSVSSIDSSENDLVTLCQQCWSADPDLRPEAALIISQLGSISSDQAGDKRGQVSKFAITKPPVMQPL